MKGKILMADLMMMMMMMYKNPCMHVMQVYVHNTSLIYDLEMNPNQHVTHFNTHS